ncbi:hypothetical protein [Altibacter sp. HG106]|uniref:hypothetical protein n=1 Tax=Altibacter sp. HG106 TaxID=3023937 RepID=UPI0023503610|nr:hypothetical protein [Altibacter sp. HG106]MDC7995001.1 hypothetical protein [Altibacter sp. HG106]
MSTKDTHERDMDLADLFDLVGQWFYRVMKHVFRAIAFLFKFWWVIALLIIGGVLLGILAGGAENHKSVLVVKTNFESQPYVYNAIEQFNANLEEDDTLFLRSVGLQPEEPAIRAVEISPVVDVVKLLEKIESSDRTFETIVSELEVKEDDGGVFASEKFYSNYDYHKLILSFHSEDGLKKLPSLLNYVNEQPYIKELVQEARKNYQERIDQNERSIAQMNKVIDVYTDASAMVNQTSSSLSFYNNASSISLREIFLYKSELTEENEILKNNMVGLEDALVVVSSAQTARDVGITDKKHIVYPFMLVFFFLLFAFLRYTYLTIKRKLESRDTRS